MSKNAADEEVLGSLHKRVAEVMIRALDVVETAQEIYINAEPEQKAEMTVPEVSASLLSAMTKFLADNKITCNPVEDKTQGELAKKLAARRKSVGNILPFSPDD